MTTQEKIKVIVGTVIFVNVMIIVVYLFFMGYPQKPWELIRYNTALTLLSAGLLYLTNQYLWRWRLINIIFGSIPNINGIWNGEIMNIKDGIKQQATLRITQSWLSVYIDVDAERGNSSTVASEIVKIGGMWKLYFTWEGRGTNSFFEGTTIVNIEKDRLEGHYFTNSQISEKNSCTSGSFVAYKK